MHHDDHDSIPRDPADLVNVDRLPPMLRTLCRILGAKVAFELCKQRGGVPLSVPSRPSADHYLVDIIGVRGMAALVDAMGSMVIDVPKYDKVAMQHRHQHVHALLKAGHGLTRSALATGYTKRQVLNIQNDLAESEGLSYTQPDLFGDDEDMDDEAVEVLAVKPADQPVSEIDEDHRELALSNNIGAHDPFGMSKHSR